MANVKASAESDAGTLDGTEIVRLSRGSGSPPTYSNVRTTTQAIANLGIVVPTSANTGLSTWINQGSAVVADTRAGITISDGTSGSSIAIRGRSKAAPSTPYVISARVSITVNPNAQSPSCGIGWYDGTKFHLAGLGYNNTSKLWQIEIDRLSNATTFSAGDGTTNANAGIIGPNMYLQIEDDGTNVHFRFSQDGGGWYQLFNVAKASGYLGSSGYSNVCFYANPQAGTSAGNVYASLREWLVS